MRTSVVDLSHLAIIAVKLFESVCAYGSRYKTGFRETFNYIFAILP